VCRARNLTLRYRRYTVQVFVRSMHLQFYETSSGSHVRPEGPDYWQRHSAATNQMCNSPFGGPRLGGLPLSLA